LFGFLVGALLGFALAAIVSLTIGALYPAEHMLRGLAGTLTAFISIPLLGLLVASRFGRRSSSDRGIDPKHSA